MQCKDFVCVSRVPGLMNQWAYASKYRNHAMQSAACGLSDAARVEDCQYKIYKIRVT